MPDSPPVIEYADRARAKLLRGERARAARIVNVYGNAYQRLQSHVERLQSQMVAEAETGQLTASQLKDLDAYRELLRQIRVELERFGQYAGAEMNQAARAALKQATTDALREVQLSLPRLGDAAVRKVWRNLPTRAVETLLGMTEPGSPLRDAMEVELGPDVASRVGDKLAENVALGKNPRTTAAFVRRELGVGLGWALRTFRTAQLWSYRASKQATWAENPRLYRGWTWHAKLSGETCAACIALHGTHHPPDEIMNDHHNGRCAPLPITPTYDELLGAHIEGDVPPAMRVPSGESWFKGQPEAVQRQVLGEARYRAWRDGAFALSDVVGKHDDSVYGEMRVEKSLKAILGPEKAREYYEQ